MPRLLWCYRRTMILEPAACVTDFCFTTQALHEKFLDTPEPAAGDTAPLSVSPSPIADRLVYLFSIMFSLRRLFRLQPSRPGCRK